MRPEAIVAAASHRGDADPRIEPRGRAVEIVRRVDHMVDPHGQRPPPPSGVVRISASTAAVTGTVDT